MTEAHEIVAWIAIGVNGVVGLWGVVLASLRRPVGHPFRVGSLAAVAIMLVQGGLGLLLYANDGEPGSGHLFYGMVIAAATAFAYIYRSQFQKREALAWGLFLLFLMGAGFRAIANVGVDFGG